MSEAGELNDEQLRALYAWIDAIPLSRPKRNIGRDFSDGVMLAEVVAAYFPALVELHNYSPAHSVQQKIYNFETLNQRVLKKLGFQIPRPVVEDIVNCRPGAIENVLNALQYKMAKYREKRLRKEGKDQVDTSPVSYGDKQRSGGGAAEVSKENAASNMKAKGKVAPTQPVSKVQVAHVRVDEEILKDKEQQIRELQETVEILELKVAKLEQLVRLKDNKIQKLIQLSSTDK